MIYLGFSRLISSEREYDALNPYGGVCAVELIAGVLADIGMRQPFLSVGARGFQAFPSALRIVRGFLFPAVARG